MPQISTLVVLSDTHGVHDDISVPPGDVLIHCGDFTTFGKYWEIARFVDWFKRQPHRHKILVPGNHEIGLCPILNPTDIGCCRGLVEDQGEFHYLVDRGVVIDGVKFWGTPWCQGEARVMEKWGFYDGAEQRITSIPDNIDILVSHDAPYGICDGDPYHFGSRALLKRVMRVKPILHLFGHIHSSAGEYMSEYTQFYNCAILDEDYHVARGAAIIRI